MTTTLSKHQDNTDLLCFDGIDSGFRIKDDLIQEAIRLAKET